MDELQNDWDRFVRKVDQQVKDFQEDVEEALDIEEDNEEEAEKREKEREGDMSRLLSRQSIVLIAVSHIQRESTLFARSAEMSYLLNRL